MPLNFFFGIPRFSAVSTRPFIRNWLFTPDAVAVTSSIPSSSFTPPPQSITVQVRNYAQTPFAATHSNFSLSVTVDNSGIQGDVLSVTSPSHNIAAPIPVVPALQPLQIVAAFNDVSVILEGVYLLFINFTVSAMNEGSGLVEVIEQRAVQVTFNRVGSSINVLVPRTINLAYLKGTNNTPTEVHAFDVFPAAFSGIMNWNLTHGPNLAVSIPGVAISLPLGGSRVNGTGVQAGTVSPTLLWEQRPAGTYSEIIQVYFNIWQATLGIAVNVAVFDLPGATVSPSLFEFRTTAPANPAAQFLDIFATGAVVLTAPPWLLVVSAGGANSTRYEVRPIDVGNFSRGQFNGDIVVTIGSQILTVPVFYQVNDDLITNLETALPNFTLDKKFVAVGGYDQNHLLQVTTTGLSYTMAGNTIPFSDVQRVPFFDFNARYVLGKLINQAMYVPTAADVLLPQLLTLFNTPGVAAALDYVAYTVTDINMKVIDRRTNVTAYERSLSSIKWVPGTSPLNRVDNRGVLSFQPRVSRITTQGVHFFNVFNFVTGAVVVHTNGVETAAYTISGDQIPFKRITINGASYLEGDRVSVSVNYVDGAGLAQSIREFVLIYPETERSLHIAFITPYHTCELLECTGQLLSGSAYQRRSNTVLRDDVSIVQHVDVNRDDQLMLQTGVIPADQRVTVDLLKRSLRAWLIHPVDGVIEISVTSAELAHSDTELFLHMYDLEFTINRSTDAQIHLF